MSDVLADIRWCNEQVGVMQARITDLERQLAEERANRAGVDRLRESHYELERMLREERAKRADSWELSWRGLNTQFGELADSFEIVRERAEAAERQLAAEREHITALQGQLEEERAKREADVEYERSRVEGWVNQSREFAVRAEAAERNYYTPCDAVCRESTGVEDACNQAVTIRRQLETAEARVRELETLVAALHKLCRCGGTGMYEPHCYRCDDSTDDHECAPDRPCTVAACVLARALAEKERGG